MSRRHRDPDRAATRRGDAGFTIIEVLVALAVLAAALTLGWRTFATGWGAIGRSEAESRALAVASSRLESAGIEIPLAAGVTSGQEGDIRWRVEVVRQDIETPAGQRPRAIPWVVRVETVWRDVTGTDRTLTLTTVKLSVAPL